MAGFHRQIVDGNIGAKFAAVAIDPSPVLEIARVMPPRLLQRAAPGAA
ncbi:MAG TPA: hypothetical protein VE263_14615 [Candidatus Angelobacter sp.]|nr:hypothetical protein [Candidatus Angelobacter sp.]